ncbi:MAG TPA: hypothetical protein PKC13_28155 [Blastocatellia bacterium]|nr:hypothetical protein [Blastocatellia bacterium]
MNPSSSSRFQVYFWLLLCAAAGAAMLFLFDDSCQMDGGQHYLFSRWAWKHHDLFVGVWSRPLFTFVYAFPSLIGFRTARALTVVICLATAWQTWRLAEDFKLPRAPLSIALLFLQPSFFLFCADTMTEPIFALVFVVALRLHHRGWIKTGMVVASLMILARPEGFFLGVLWAVWTLRIADCGLRISGWKTALKKLPESFESAIRNPQSAIQLSWLVAGSFLWWLAALLLTGDPLFIKHNWPNNWPLTGTVYGAQGLIAFPSRLPEVVGLLLLPVFVYGLVWLLKRRQLPTLTSSFLLLFVLHTILRAYGLLGSAGYPRYLVAISPAIALITLAGWNELAGFFAHVSRPVKTGCAAVLLGTSAWINFVYADGAEWSRDAVAINAAFVWFQSQAAPPEISKFIWSKPYSCILFDRDPWENPGFTHHREQDVNLLAEMPAGTLVLWDERVGPKEYGLRAEDFQAAGFELMHSQAFQLHGYLLDRSWFGFGGARRQGIHLLYKFKKP